MVLFVKKWLYVNNKLPREKNISSPLKLNILQDYINEHHVRRNADETRVKIIDEDDITEANERTSLIGVNTRAIDVEVNHILVT